MDPPTSPALESSGPEPSWPGGLKRLADRYQLEEPIASGGAAIVWRAFDDVLSRSVAIKLLHPYLATDPTTVERFRLESINAARLTHQNVVAIYDTGQEVDIVYLVMEFVDGPSLRELLQDLGPLNPEIVAALGEQVASALGEAHSQGVVHRDVKPANILMTSDGVAKVTDFGIAKALSGNQATLTNPGTVVGTAAYVAPEQLEGRNVDARADIYALGVVLYECLTGQPAFQGDTPTATAAARLTQELMPPRQVRADVPRALDDIIVRATRRDPDLRFADGAAMATALAPLVRSRPSDVTAMLVAPDRVREVTSDVEIESGPYSGSMPASVRGEYGRRLVAAFLGGLLLALLGFFAVQAIRDDTEEPNPVPGFVQLGVVDAGDFDPNSADGRENPGELEAAHDGDLGTAWNTERYFEPLAAVKGGVGAWFDLGERQTVEAIKIDLMQGGMALEVYTADQLPDLENDRLEGWGEPITERSGLLIDDTVEVDVEARYFLLWMTELPEVEPGTYQGRLAEIRFLHRGTPDGG